MKTPAQEARAADRRRQVRELLLEAVREYGNPVSSVEELRRLVPSIKPAELDEAVPLLLLLSSRLPGGGGADHAKQLEQLMDNNNQLRERIGRLNLEVGNAEKNGVELLRLLRETERENVDNEFKVRAVADMFDAWLLPMGRLPLDTRAIADARVEAKIHPRGDTFSEAPRDMRVDQVRPHNPEPYYPTLDQKISQRLAEYPTTAWVIAQLEHLFKLKQANLKKKGKSKK
jgi:hypothetical protein